ncbi:hypothetical protein LXA43DRAFT_551658 [Ganoderma leucocontextum]|nr:hypothetical protein LXA43DRAFT_551658 [Ganoderma leucocontextum]
MKELPPPDLRSLTSVFFAVHLAGGHIGLPILVATFLLSKTANRHPTVVNFCIIWILYSIIYCLLIYGGDAWLDNPRHELCLAQAAMNYAAPPMAVVAGFEVVLQIWSTFIEPWKHVRLACIPPWMKLVAIVAPPYLTFIAFAVPATVVGLRHPEWVQVKTGLYCGLMHGHFEKFAVPTFCSVFLTLTIGLEVASIVQYIRGRHNIKKDFPLVTAKRPSLSPWARAALFLVYSAMALSACIMVLKQSLNVFAYMIQAALPLAAFLVFGLQKDVLMVWLCCNRRRHWDREDSTRASNESPRIIRTNSLASQATMECTSPIATTHPSSSIV